MPNGFFGTAKALGAVRIRYPMSTTSVKDLLKQYTGMNRFHEFVLLIKKSTKGRQQYEIERPTKYFTDSTTWSDLRGKLKEVNAEVFVPAAQS